MKKIVITFGLVSGGVLAAVMAVTAPLCMNGTLHFDNSEVIGYSAMVLAFLSVFFGIRAYRQDVGGGVISFGKAFKVGILITLISSAIYVIAWEIISHAFLPDFADKYVAHVIDKLRASGASAANVAAEQAKMARFKELYANPFFNVGMTFMEVFPVGLIVTLVSAAILRRKAVPAPPSSARAVA